jgi:hypothetical protein
LTHVIDVGERAQRVQIQACLLETIALQLTEPALHLSDAARLIAGCGCEHRIGAVALETRCGDRPHSGVHQAQPIGDMRSRRRDVAVLDQVISPDASHAARSEGSLHARQRFTPA